MERRDGRDPLNAKTYSSPATIQSMIELRAFCAAFFDQLVRVRAPPINDHLLARFVTLITSKAALFARARAVIPELQLRLLNSEMAHLHPNVQRVLQATEDLRRSPDADGGVLIEGSVWSRLAQDGQERFGSEAEVVMRESKARPRKTSGANSPLGPDSPTSTPITVIRDFSKQPAIASSPTRSSLTTPTRVMDEAAAENSHPLRRKPANIKVGLTAKGDLDAIPTFVPQNQMGDAEQLVWSPTSGTRPRRPEEMYHQGPSGVSQVAPTLGQEISPNVPRTAKPHRALSSLKAETPKKKKKHGRNLSTDSVMVQTEPYQNTPSPLGPGSSPRPQFEANTPSRHRVRSNSSFDIFTTPRGNDKGKAGEFGPGFIGVDDELLSREDWDEIPPSSGYIGLRHPVDHAQRDDLHSAPPSIPSFGDKNVSSQGLHGGPATPAQVPPRVPHNTPQSPGIQLQAGGLQYGASPSQSIQRQTSHSNSRGQLFSPHTDLAHAYHTLQHSPFSNSYGPHAHSPAHPSILGPYAWNSPSVNLTGGYNTTTATTTNPETLHIPPPGSLSPPSYWNLLHHRSTNLQHLLAKNNVPITPTQRDYIARLHEARIVTIATAKLFPLRKGKSAEEWMKFLEGELKGLWEGKGQVSEIFVERKKDFEEACRREMSAVLEQIGKGGERG